jgi:glycopeptide antibiotics resistance protein
VLVRIMKRMLSTIIRISYSILFLVYLYFLARVILFKHYSSHIELASILDNFNIFSLKRQVLYSNFIPFKTIIDYVFYEENQNIAIRNILGNIIIFVPFGFLLPLIVTRKFKIFSIVTLSFLLSLVLELVQFFSGIGSFDVDDLILNTFGALLGFRILNIFTNFRRGISRERNQPLS